MSEGSLSRITIRAATAEDFTRIGAAMARAFELSGDAAEWVKTQWPDRILQRPGFRPEQSRVAIAHGQIVAHALVEFFTLRYGRARIKVVGIGKVFTEKGYRRRGYSTEILRDALAFGVEQGAELALLNGGAGFYDRFGFMPIWPIYRAEFVTDQCAQLPRPYLLRPAETRDFPHMADLFERHWGGRVTFARSPEQWAWRAMGGDDSRHAWVVINPDSGRIEGYLAARSPLSNEVEVITNTPEAAQTLLATVAGWVERMGEGSFSWLLPPDDALFDYAREWVNVKLSAQYQPDGGWMGRLLDAKALLNKIMPEIAGQARFMIPDLNPDTIVINYSLQGVEVGLRGQPATLTRLSLRDFVQVMFGALSPITLGWRYQLNPEALRLLQALFPPRLSTIAYWDWF